jgi:hypothetical protein
MSKGHSRNRSTKRNTRTYSTSYRPSQRLRFSNPYSTYNDRFVQSRRVYVPTYTPIKKTTKKVVSTYRLQPNNLKVKKTVPLPYSASPRQIQKALVCVKRKTRTQVMHAMKHSGKGGQKKPRHTPQSKIKC